MGCDAEKKKIVTLSNYADYYTFGYLLSFCCVYLHEFLWNTALESVWRYKEHLGANPRQNIYLK